MILITMFLITNEQDFNINSNAMHCIWKSENLNKIYHLFENYFSYLLVS